MLKLTTLNDRPGWYKLDGYVGSRRYRKTFEAPTRKLAEEYRVKIERELWESETLGRQHDATLTQCAEHYIAKGGETRFLIPLIERWGAKKVRDLTEQDVTRAAESIYPGRAPATIRRQLYVPLNAVIAAGHRANLCPPLHFQPPKIKRQERDYADDDWMKAFMAAAARSRPPAGLRIASIVLFMTLTGSRVSEACRVRVRDIEPGYVTLRMTKTGTSRRVRCPRTLMVALDELCDGKGPEDLVWGYAGRDVVNKAIKRVCQRAGIRYLSSHQCGRHAFAARLLKAGNSLRVVQSAGGWSTITMVADTYGHLEQSQVDDAIDRMGEVVPRIGATDGETDKRRA